MDNELINRLSGQVPKVHKKERNIDAETGFLLRQVYGETERFVYHTHEYYEIFLTVSGKIKHYVNEEMQILEPGCLVFVRPKDKHFYVYQNTKNYSFINLALEVEIIEGMFSYIKGAFDGEWLLKAQLPPVVRLTDYEMRNLMKSINNLNTLPSDENVTKRLRIREVVLETFIKYFFSSVQEEKIEIPLWLEYTCEKMKKPENFTAGIKRMVQISGKTQEHLSRSVKKYYDVTLSCFINELRLNYAVNMLLNSNLKVTDICYESGFGNMSCFYTLFKKRYGLSPEKFRKEYIK